MPLCLDDTSVRVRVADGEVLGPRIFTTGPILDGVDPRWPGSRVLVDSERAVAAVDGKTVFSLDPKATLHALDAATATPIKNGSGLTSSRAAISIAMGAAITAVAVLFMTSESVIVTTTSKVSTTTGEKPAEISTIPPAMSAVPPVACSAPPIGIMHPNSTMTGHSTES